MEQVLVLTAAEGVTDATVGAVLERIGQQGVPVRLDATAVEVAVVGLDAAALRAATADMAVDANLVPVANRRKRLLIADMDSTMINIECIDELADFAGVRDRVAAITERAMRGELDFEAALRARVVLLRGLPETVLADCFAERVRLNPGARRLVRTMAALGADTALVSGGFTWFTERVAAAAGFARHRANGLVISNGRLTGEVTEPILGRAAKLACLREFAAAAGIGPADVVAVGDGANDLDMVTAAGLGVAWRAKPALAEAAGARLVHSDLTAILALQGIPGTDWRD